jgi:hypothetical protein
MEWECCIKKSRWCSWRCWIYKNNIIKWPIKHLTILRRLIVVRLLTNFRL